jgi:hypothetical protein
MMSVTASAGEADVNASSAIAHCIHLRVDFIPIRQYPKY